MRLSFAVPLAAALALAACNRHQDNSDNAAGGAVSQENAAAAVSAVHFQPGLYQTKVDITKIDLPGMPPAVASGVRGAMAAKPLTYCLSAADAADGAAAMKKHMAKGQCRFDKFDVGGGTIDTVMSCPMGKGTLTGTGHGTYTDTGSVVTSSSDMTMPTGGRMHIEEVVTTTRIGDCAR